MKRSSTVSLVFLMLSVLLFQGCLLDVTSVVIPSSTSTGKVITLTVNATATSDGTNHYGGLILQIPNGTSVLRVGYQGSASGIMIENTSITAGYIPESGYHLYGALAPSSHDGDNSVITFKVWLSVPNGVTPGTYTVKAAVGGKTESGMWVPQNPQATGSPVLHFSQISGKYASNSIVISPGATDSVAPADVTPTVSEFDSITAVISSYDEAVQGDVAKYRVYLSKALFSVTAGGQLLDNTTAPSVTGAHDNNVTFSADIGAGLSYFEIPPGSEYSLWINGLSWSAYYFAVTAVDLSGNESNPVVVNMPARGSIAVSLTDGTNPVQPVSPSFYDTNCNVINSSISMGASDGNYTVTLPIGSYKVLFDVTSAGYVSQWYNNKSSCAAADIVTVTEGNVTNMGVMTLAPSCTYTISPASKTFTSKGGSGSVTVTASATTCAWTATESLDWVSITSGSSGTGSGTVAYSVSANTSKAARTGNMTIAGKTFTITQKGKR